MVNLEVFITATVGVNLSQLGIILNPLDGDITPPSFGPRSMDGQSERQWLKLVGEGGVLDIEGDGTPDLFLHPFLSTNFRYSHMPQPSYQQSKAPISRIGFFFFWWHLFSIPNYSWGFGASVPCSGFGEFWIMVCK